MITNILLKKKINLTPYSLISNFKKKEKTTLSCNMRTYHFLF